MESQAATEWRTRIRATAHYLRTIRPLIQRAAAEHAAWAQFMARALSPAHHISTAELIIKGSRFAITFTGVRGEVKRLEPTPSCAAVHAATLSWLEVLDLLAGAVPPVLERGGNQDLIEIGREASEAQLRLRTFQRTHATTIASLKQMFAARPRTVHRPRRATRAPAAKRAPPPDTTNLPPWRRRRPASARP